MVQSYSMTARYVEALALTCAYQSAVLLYCPAAYAELYRHFFHSARVFNDHCLDTAIAFGLRYLKD